MKKVIKVAAMLIFVGFIAWFILSWVDIVADNTQPNPHHSKYNMFVVFFSDKEDEIPDKNSLVPIKYEEEPVENTEGNAEACSLTGQGWQPQSSTPLMITRSH